MVSAVIAPAVSRAFWDFYRGRRVLVTGDTGFKGGWLCAWLHRLGAEVHGIALPADTTDGPWAVLRLEERVGHRDVDVRSASALAQAFSAASPEVVFHLAAQALVRRSYQDPLGTFATNLTGTLHVLEAIRQTPSVRAAVIVTTDKVYEQPVEPAPATHDRPAHAQRSFREDDPLGGHDPYSASKAAAEIAVASWRRSFATMPGGGVASACIATGRAGNVVGGGDWAEGRIVPDIVRAVRDGVRVELRNPRSIRPWQHVLDAVAGYLVLGRELAGERGPSRATAWNFGPTEAATLTVEELTRAVIAALGRGSITLSAQPTGPHEAASLRLDCGKAQRELAWRPVWNIARAVEHTAAWYRAFLDAGPPAAADAFARQIDAFESDARAARLTWAGCAQ